MNISFGFQNMNSNKQLPGASEYWCELVNPRCFTTPLLFLVWFSIIPSTLSSRHQAPGVVTSACLGMICRLLQLGIQSTHHSRSWWVSCVKEIVISYPHMHLPTIDQYSTRRPTQTCIDSGSPIRSSLTIHWHHFTSCKVTQLAKSTLEKQTSWH